MKNNLSISFLASPKSSEAAEKLIGNNLLHLPLYNSLEHWYSVQPYKDHNCIKLNGCNASQILHSDL